MAIFRVKVRHITVSDTYVLVDADSELGAIEYMNSNSDWQEDNAIGEGSNENTSMSTCFIKESITEISATSEIVGLSHELRDPKSYHPYNRKDNLAISDLLS